MYSSNKKSFQYIAFHLIPKYGIIQNILELALCKKRLKYYNTGNCIFGIIL